MINLSIQESPFSKEFDYSYIRSDVSGSTPVFRFPEGKRELGNLVVEFVLTGNRWIGIFKGWFEGHTVKRQVYPTPNPSHALVISRSLAYLVDVNLPSRTISLELGAIERLYAIQALGLLLVQSATSLACLNLFGKAWLVEDIAADGLEIVEEHGNRAVLSVWRSDVRASRLIDVSLIDGKLSVRDV